MKNYIILFLFLLPSVALFSQEDSTDIFEEELVEEDEMEEEPARNWALTGYVKDMRTMLFFPNADQIVLDNLVHNRLNFEWYMDEKWTFKADMRNRMFYGNLVQLDTAYADKISDANNDVLDMSVVIVDRNALVIHSMIDRLSFNYQSGNWNVTLGRQRINWGINTFFNPNDVFNTYNFTDFDYEERPGSDALHVQYYTGVASSVEFGIKAFTSMEDFVAAGLWKFNAKNYDFQVLGGVAYEDVVLGGGWAGNIGNAGFKGEFTTFMPYENLGDSVSFAATLGVDYSFKNSTFVGFGFLFNSNGTDDKLDLTSQGLTIGSGNSATLTAKNLYPYKYAMFASVGYPFSPIFSGNLAIVYSPSNDQAVFLNPTFTASLTQNLDLDVVGQLFTMNFGGQYSLMSRAVFLRLKRSF